MAPRSKTLPANAGSRSGIAEVTPPLSPHWPVPSLACPLIYVSPRFPLPFIAGSARNTAGTPDEEPGLSNRGDRPGWITEGEDGRLEHLNHNKWEQHDQSQ